jgi:hypothetical protein
MHDLQMSDLVAQLVGLDLWDVGDQSFAERFFLDF